MAETVKAEVIFSDEWLLKVREDIDDPAGILAEELTKRLSASDVRSSVFGCRAVLEVPEKGGKEALKDSILDIVKELFHEDNICEIEIEGFVQTADTSEKEQVRGKENSGKVSAPKGKLSESTPERIKSNTAEKIAGLIGADEFKALASEIQLAAANIKSRRLTEQFAQRTYLISVNSGYGLTTYLDLFAELVDDLGLFKAVTSTKAEEIKLPPPSSESELARAVDTLERSGRIFCIRLDDWLNRMNTPQFRDVISVVEKNAGKSIYFFSIPFLESDTVETICETLNDRLFVKQITISPFGSDQLIGCAKEMLFAKGFTFDEDVVDILNRRIVQEKNDGRFYGLNTVRKIVNELLYTKVVSDAQNNSDSTVIRAADIASLVSGDDAYEESGYEMLDHLIGMKSIREKIDEIVAQIEASMRDDSMEPPCIHMRFTGNPGTGKTTVARILGRVLKEKGILRNGYFFEHFSRDLCGSYIGETAPKTSAICRDAYGSVLFIDEAYSLYRGSGTSSRDYGREAIDTLIAEMENHRTDFVVIMAGYTDEMETLMEANTGLRSRMPYVIEFPNYTREELTEIFMSMVGDRFKYKPKFRKAVTEYMNGLTDEFLGSKEFSNARFVRNVFQRTFAKAAMRCRLGNKPVDELTAADFEQAVSDKEFIIRKPEKRRPIGFQ